MNQRKNKKKKLKKVSQHQIQNKIKKEEKELTPEEEAVPKYNPF